MIYLLAVTFILAFYITRMIYFKRELDPSQKIVVVTGCDSGIGHALALKAARTWGCVVVGTCLEPDGNAGMILRAAGIHVVKLDLMEEDSTKELLKLVNQLETNGKKLWALVNNAGVLTIAACEWQTEQLVTQQIQVNLTGAINVTSRLLPKIRRNKGRIVMVSSPTAQVACPNMSVYSASKFGIEGFAQALRREVEPLGVRVSVVRPCNLPNHTGLLRDNARRLRHMIDRASEETRLDYGSLMEQTESHFARGYANVQEIQEIKDSLLMLCFKVAILSQEPKKVYAAAPFTVRIYLAVAQVLPTEYVDYLVVKGYHEKMMSFALMR
ncbi:short-chain dehydrogenase/reductase family 9C member 7-like [Macrobrachium rosenbergii]|uniref:short-chain dehydrogenase/reductase family 9C member 7-like n=1 Tax=Macrobrachium rosenbergii TaxID=79674 RepID=UPI0034D79CF7